MPDTDVQERPPTRAELVADLATFNDAIKALTEKGGEDLSGLDADEAAELQEFLEAAEEVQGAIKAMPDPSAMLSRAAAIKADTGTVRRPNLSGNTTNRTVPGSGTVTVSPAPDGQISLMESEDEKFLKRGPWKSFGHFCHALRMCGESRPGLVRDDSPLGLWNRRIVKVDEAIKSWSEEVKAATGMSEFSDPEGAAFVPVEFSQTVWERPQIQLVNLMQRCDVTPISGNTLVVRAWKDNTRTNFQLYGGATAYWRAEAAQMTSSKPATRDLTLKLNELYAFFYATDELLMDAPALTAELTKVASLAITAKSNDAIINGDGVGKPIGIMKSGALITTATQGGGANTIIGKDIDAMWSRRSPNFNGVWLYNLDCEPQFAQLNYLAVATNTTYAAAWLYVPQGGISGKSYDTLKGREMIETEYCAALGTTGDLILADLSQYKCIVKSSGIQNAVSMHLRFDYGEVAFRWTFRMDGKPYWETPLTPARGTNTRSPFIALPSTRT